MSPITDGVFGASAGGAFGQPQAAPTFGAAPAFGAAPQTGESGGFGAAQVGAAKPRSAGRGAWRRARRVGTAEPGPAGDATGGSAPPAADPPQTVRAADSPAPPKSAPEFTGRSITMETAFQPRADGRHCRSRVVNGVLTFEWVRGDEESCSEYFARLAAQRREAEAAVAAAEADLRRFALSIASLERAGDVAALVRGMQRYGADAAVQHAGCGALQNLALNNDANKAAIAAQGGIGAVLGAMGGHRESAGVQKKGCGALRTLAYNSADNKAAVAAQGGIGVVLGAMGGHPENAGVQEEGCGALRTLACNDDNMAAIAAQGGIGAVLGAMGGHPESAGVQEEGCGVLRNLASSSSSDMRPRVKQAGVEETVRRAMAPSGAKANTKKWGQELLDWLE